MKPNVAAQLRQAMSDGLGDWRFGAVSTLSKGVAPVKPGGAAFPAGTKVLLTTVSFDRNGQQVGFVAPSATALAINIAISAARQAEVVRPKVPHVVIPGSDGPINSIPSEQSSSLFDFFEQCLIAVTFSFQSIETFCNHTISRSQKAKIEVRRRRDKFLLTPEEVERTLSTEEKVGKVLPKLLDCATPSGKAVWERLLKLQRIRDAAIHLKGHDQYPRGGVDRESLFFQLLTTDPYQYPEAAVAVIGHFCTAGNMPRWLNEMPQIRPEENSSATN